MILHNSWRFLKMVRQLVIGKVMKNNLNFELSEPALSPFGDELPFRKQYIFSSLTQEYHFTSSSF